MGQSDIPFSKAARNLGVLFDSQLALKEQVNKHYGSIQSDSIFESTITLVSSLVLSRLDYCNALLAGPPQVLLDKIKSDELLSSPHLQSS